MRISRHIAAGLILSMLSFVTANASVFQSHYVATGVATSIDLLLDYNSAINGLGGHDVVGVTGTVNGNSVTGIIAPIGAVNTIGSIIYDNTLFDGFPHFDFNGLFLTVAGGPNANIYYYSPLNSDYYLTQEMVNGGNSLGVKLTEVSLTAVPEPSTVALIAIAFLSLLGFSLLRQRAQL